jgi:hypothetical protein
VASLRAGIRRAPSVYLGLLIPSARASFPSNAIPVAEDRSGGVVGFVSTPAILPAAEHSPNGSDRTRYVVYSRRTDHRPATR